MVAGTPDSRSRALGFRRVSFLRVCLDGPEPRYEAVGTVHRRTVCRTVSPHTARDLVRAGVPSVVRRPTPAGTGR